MKLSEVIQWCANIEQLIAEVYETFAERFPEPPAVGELWRALAVEERAHEARLTEIAGLPAAGGDDPSLTREQLESLRARVLAHLTPGARTLDDAFAAAIDLETLELDNIYRRLFALTTTDSRMSAALRAALGQFDRHERRIIEAIEKHATDRKLVARAAHEGERMLKHGAA